MPSNPSCICEVENFVKELMGRHTINEDLYPNILISLTEAVNNAMIHGNRMDTRKEIIITCQENGDRIQFLISDEGSGFDPKDLPDPTCEERITQEGGRGVFLMKQLADEIHFLNKGRTVRLMWKI